jgi:TrmH family RNA methyltransferase
LEDIQDPGNLGTIIRAGEGAGVSGIIMTQGTADIFNPKVIRSTMGSIYRVPFFVVESLGDVIETLKAKGISVYAAHLDESIDYDKADYTKPTAFLIGNEAKGLKRETADLATGYIKIPMAGQVESLNAAVATTILMYEAQRQRRKEYGKL